MRLEGDFYNIEYIERLGDRITAVVSLNPDHPVYQGHFPQKAVVPGVCTLTVIRECIGKALDRNIAFCTIKECKYVSALLPHKDLKIRIEADLSRSVQDSGLDPGLTPESYTIKALVRNCGNEETILKLKAGIK